MTKKKTIAKKPELAKKAEPVKAEETPTAPSVAVAEPTKLGMGPMLLTKFTKLEKDAKDLLHRVTALERELKWLITAQTRVKEQYNAFTRKVDDKVLNLTNNAAFGEGMRFVIITAETNLAKALKLPDRNALSSDGRNLPSWWLATLMQLYDYLPAKPIEPVKPAVVAIVAGRKETIRKAEEA